MDKTVKDGGPAFPEAIAISPSGDVHPGYGGMTLRDYLAGQALTSMAGLMMQSGYEEQRTPKAIYAGIAKAAYGISDAMLAARSPNPAQEEAP